MEQAFERAKEALSVGEVPVGCLMVYDNKIIANGRNRVNETKNATRHAEMDCVDQVIEWCKSRNLNSKEVFKEVEVFVTVEPCIMCTQALRIVEVKAVTCGCSNVRFGGCGSVLDAHTLSNGLKELNVVSGVRAEEAVNLLKLFYEGENPNAPNPKPKKKRT